jgi:hypothetical protein
MRREREMAGRGSRREQSVGRRMRMKRGRSMRRWWLHAHVQTASTRNRGHHTSVEVSKKWRADSQNTTRSARTHDPTKCHARPITHPIGRIDMHTHTDKSEAVCTLTLRIKLKLRSDVQHSTAVLCGRDESQTASSFPALPFPRTPNTRACSLR